MSGVDGAALERGLERAAAAQDALERGDPGAARDGARDAVAVFRVELGDRSPDLANLLVVQSQAERLLGDVDAAQACATEAVAIMVALPGGDVRDRIRVQARRALGEVLLHRGDPARESFLVALDDAEQTLGAVDADSASLLNCLGIVGKHTGDFDDAQRRYYARALAIIETTVGPDDVQAASLHHNLGGLGMRAASTRRASRTPAGRAQQRAAHRRRADDAARQRLAVAARGGGRPAAEPRGRAYRPPSPRTPSSAQAAPGAADGAGPRVRNSSRSALGASVRSRGYATRYDVAA